MRTRKIQWYFLQQYFCIFVVTIYIALLIILIFTFTYYLNNKTILIYTHAHTNILFLSLIHHFFLIIYIFIKITTCVYVTHLITFNNIRDIKIAGKYPRADDPSECRSFCSFLCFIISYRREFGYFSRENFQRIITLEYRMSTMATTLIHIDEEIQVGHAVRWTASTGLWRFSYVISYKCSARAHMKILDSLAAFEERAICAIASLYLCFTSNER